MDGEFLDGRCSLVEHRFNEGNCRGCVFVFYSLVF